MKTYTWIDHALLIGAAMCATYFVASQPTYHEKKVVSQVKFFVSKEHTLRPVMPIELVVVQEQGGIADEQMITCDVIARTHEVMDVEPKNATETVLKCGDRTYVVSGVSF